jgi:hypothetical protein
MHSIKRVDLDAAIEDEIVAAISRTFSQFALLAFADKQRILRGAIREVVVDLRARAIITVTVRGGYLGKDANSALRSKWQLSRRRLA